MSEIIVNGEVNHQIYRDSFDPPDRAIKLPNITIELERTPDGGWREKTTDYSSPEGGSGRGHTLNEMVKHHSWVAEQLWRRVVEVEDELRTLRKAISYKE